MRLHSNLLVSPFAVALCACSASQQERANAAPIDCAAPSNLSDPPSQMAPFARLADEEWQVGFASGETGTHAWQWGPGKYSIRQVANSSSFEDNPWQGQVIFWHPGEKQIRLLSMHGDIPAVGRGIAEGPISFEGETEVGFFDLYQPRGLRKIGHRRTFEGADTYHEDLLEDTGAGYRPLAGWDFHRVRNGVEPKPRDAVDSPPSLPDHFKPFAPLLGRTLEARGDVDGSATSGSAVRIHTTFEWVPSLEVICVRVMELDRDVTSTHVLDAYLFQHLGADEVRCLVLSNRGGVYEGTLTTVDGGAVQIDLTGYEGDRVAPRIVRLDVEGDGTLRERTWSRDRDDPVLLHERRHRIVE